jgi:hypothetical protein
VITRVVGAVLMVGSWALAGHILAILFTGGYVVELFGIPLLAGRATPPLMVLLALIALGIVVKRADGSPRSSSSDFVMVCCVFLFIYLANGRTIWTGDTLGARYLPLSILREGNFDLNEFPFLYSPSIPYFVRVVNGHYVSDYPIGAALVALPFYLPTALGPVSPTSPIVQELEKISAATIVALSAAVLYLTARRLSAHWMAVALSVVYALGSSSLSVSSQALWQHGSSQLALSSALYCLVRGRSEVRWVGFAGFPLAFAVVSRPTDVLMALPISMYLLVHHRGQVWRAIVTALPPILFQLLYNGWVFGNPLRTQFSILGGGRVIWTTPLLEGLHGILLSPSRGLFVYSPIFVLSVVGAGLAWRRNGDVLLRYLSVGVALTILLYSKLGIWWAGHTYGPRFLADLGPALTLLLFPLEGFLVRSRLLLSAFVLLATWSVAVHALGAFWDDLRWHVHVDVRNHPEWLWSWSNNQLTNAVRAVARRVAKTLLAMVGVS